MEKITTLAIDTAKSSFVFCGLNDQGKVALKKAVSRDKLPEFMAQFPQCTVVMEACGGSHHWARSFRSFGHDVKLIAAQKVVPFRKANKNDTNDALAIARAFLSPGMEFVQIKEIWQQDIQALHRIRERHIKNQTALVNEMRGLLLEYGLVIKQGINHARSAIPMIVQDRTNCLSPVLREEVAILYDELLTITGKIEELDLKLAGIAKEDARCQRLMKIDGIGVITATALVAACGDPRAFKNGRQFSAWLGLVPGHTQTGGKHSKPIMLGITKRGDSYLRSLLVQGGISIVRAVKAQEKKEALQISSSSKPESSPKAEAQLKKQTEKAEGPCKKRSKASVKKGKGSEERRNWLRRIIHEKGTQKAAVAFANKNARIVWALLVGGEEYKPEKCCRAKAS